MEADSTEQDCPSNGEMTTVQAIFVRRRNCLLLQADFSPLFVDYYLHLMQHGLRHAPTEDGVLKDLLAWFTLHLVSRPWRENHAWTLNVHTPSAANYFVSGSSTDEAVVGHAYTEGVRETEHNLLYAQNVGRSRELQTSVVTLPEGGDVAAWIESYYRQSEQRPARAFLLPGSDTYALVTAEPGADYDWLDELRAEDVARIATTEQTKLLETRRFRFCCGCTVEKVLPIIRAMHRDFADRLSEQGFLEISCPRCGAVYRITPEMVNKQA